MMNIRLHRAGWLSVVTVAVGASLALAQEQWENSSLPAGIEESAEDTSADGEAGARSGDGRIAKWRSAGHDLSNSRSQPRETQINATNANRLTPKWTFTTEGDVWATPSVDANYLYFPDAAGNLFAVNRASGAQLWKRKIAEYTGIANVISRNTPAISGRTLVLGDQGGRLGAGAKVFAVDKRNGNKLWATQVDSHPAAVITQSPVIHEGVVYVGVSSVEETLAATAPGYTCCSFRGSVLALDQFTGAILWKTYMVPGEETPGFAGGAVWSSTPVVDQTRNSLYITTGNNYTVPVAILDCQGLPTPAEVEQCVAEVPGSEHNHFDAIVSLNLRTGAIKWARSMIPFDSWNIACLFSVPGNEGNCTDPKGEDYDFGQGATLYRARLGRRTRQLLGAGQKSGVYWAVDPSNGDVVWSTQVGPGGSLGGLEWGSATDGTRIYTAVANSGSQPWTLPSGEVATSGFWSALDAATGAVLWATRGFPAVSTTNQGPVSVANGVVYGGTIDGPGTMYALNAANGSTLWTFASGGSVNAGAAIVDGTVYWGSGYGVPGFGLTPNNKLHAFVLGSGVPPDAGTDAGTDAGSDAGTDAGVPDASTGPTWSALYTAYFAAGTVGHCSNCHAPTNTATGLYTFLQTRGQIDGVNSRLAQTGNSILTWFGGTMPLGGPSSLPQAEADVRAWVAAGALNN
jgi:polyvinyl alcohol dehydrogenase (cytochrome)